jgi:hypothetical protein
MFKIKALGVRTIVAITLGASAALVVQPVMAKTCTKPVSHWMGPALVRSK